MERSLLFVSQMDTCFKLYYFHYIYKLFLIGSEVSVVVGLALGVSFACLNHDYGKTPWPIGVMFRMHVSYSPVEGYMYTVFLHFIF